MVYHNPCIGFDNPASKLESNTLITKINFYHHYGLSENKQTQCTGGTLTQNNPFFGIHVESFRLRYSNIHNTKVENLLTSIWELNYEIEKDIRLKRILD